MKPHWRDEQITTTRTKSEPGTSPGTLEVAEVRRKMPCLTTEHVPGAQMRQELEGVGLI